MFLIAFLFLTVGVAFLVGKGKFLNVRNTSLSREFKKMLTNSYFFKLGAFFIIVIFVVISVLLTTGPSNLGAFKVSLVLPGDYVKYANWGNNMAGLIAIGFQVCAKAIVDPESVEFLSILFTCTFLIMSCVCMVVIYAKNKFVKHHLFAVSGTDDNGTEMSIGDDKECADSGIDSDDESIGDCGDGVEVWFYYF